MGPVPVCPGCIEGRSGRISRSRESELLRDSGSQSHLSLTAGENEADEPMGTVGPVPVCPSCIEGSVQSAELKVEC